MAHNFRQRVINLDHWREVSLSQNSNDIHAPNKSLTRAAGSVFSERTQDYMTNVDQMTGGGARSAYGPARKHFVGDQEVGEWFHEPTQ